MSTKDDDAYVDPVVEFYKRGVDRTLIRENLRRTPTERLLALEDLQRSAEELRRAGEVIGELEAIHEERSR